jgi:hypothetical protein
MRNGIGSCKKGLIAIEEDHPCIVPHKMLTPRMCTKSFYYSMLGLLKNGKTNQIANSLLYSNFSIILFHKRGK